MSVELVQDTSQLNLVMFIQIFTHVKFAENKEDFIFILLLSLCNLWRDTACEDD